MLVAIAVFAIGHPSGQKLSNQASRKFGLGGRSSSNGDFDVDSSGGDGWFGRVELEAMSRRIEKRLRRKKRKKRKRRRREAAEMV